MPEVSMLVLGTGRWGLEWLGVLAAVDGVTVAGTAGHGRAPDIAGLPSGSKNYPDYRAAIDGCDADAVLITLPIKHHTDAILRSLAAGRHVLCEKPVAGNPAEVRKLLTAADDHPDRVVMVNQNYRWRPWARFVRSKVEAGAIGPIAHVSVRFSQPEILIGGRGDLDHPLLQDMSIHHFDLLRYLTGKNAVEVYARGHRPPWTTYRGCPGLDAIFTMEDDLRVNYSGSWAGRGRATTWDGDWRIEGEGGVLSLSEGRVTIEADRGGGDVSPAGNSTGEAELLDVPSTARGDLHTSLEDFRRAVDLGLEPESGIRDNCHSIGMVYGAEASLEAGQPAQIEKWSR